MERADLEQWRAREVARLLTLVETQRRYYQDIVASIPVGLLVLSSDLAILLANGAARRIFGLRGGDSPHRRLDTILPSWLLDRVEEVLRTSLPQTGILVETEREGAKRRLRVGILAIRNWDDEGAKEALLSVEDLTEQEAAFMAEPALAPEPPVEAPETPAPVAEPEPPAPPAPAVAASEFIEHLDQVSWAVELPGMNFVFVSPQAEKLLGYPAEHWTGNASFWEDRVHEADRGRVMQSYQRAVESGAPLTCEFRAVGSDGRVRWLRESAKVLPSLEGQPSYLIGVTVDVTERRLLEDQLIQSERVEAVSRLASRMAHDLNNMLMILTGYGEELLNSIPAGSALRSDVQEILSATERMSGFTSQLLSFARRQASPANVLELEPVLRNAGRKWGALTGSGVGLDLHLCAEPNSVRGDAAQLEQVVTAILERARPALAGGAIRIETSRLQITEDLRRTHAPLQPGTYAVISVHTPLAAVEGEAKACLFECSLPGKEPWDETAAALSRAYGTVRQWGGDIAVSDGEAGGGTVFRVFLPCVEAPAVVPAAPAAEQPAAPVKEAPLATILVVEDEAGIRALVRKILRRQGYEVLEAANGQDALALCRDHSGPIDLLITDVLMPQMGGRELVERLHEQGREMKVLYVSGYTDDATMYSGELPAGTAFLQKPFTLGSLLDKVKEVLAPQ